MKSIPTKLFSRFQVNDNGCWLYSGVRNSYGYGIVDVAGKKLRAHRLSFEICFGPIPEDKIVCHKCDTPECFNPFHLFLGTHQDNIADKVQKNRTIYGSSHPRAKLDEASVKIIREARRYGYRRREIGGYFKISLSVLDKVISKKTWARV